MVVIVVAALVVTSFATLKGDWSGLFSIESAKQMAVLITSFFPPALDPPFLVKIFWGMLETIAISFLGTLLAVGTGIALAVPAAGINGIAARGFARFALNGLRAVPELVWAGLLVIAAGLGPFPGTLALAFHTTGVLGRLLADALENAPTEPYAALRRNGVSPLAAFFYGTLPTVLPQLVSYTLYRWENNIRAAAVLGVAGAGGLGQLLFYHMGLLHFRETGTILFAMIALVGAVDAASHYIRRRLEG